MSQEVRELLGLTTSNGCIRTIWIGTITDGRSGAFSMRTSQISIFSSKGTQRVLAHELGHLLGLSDIYDFYHGKYEMAGHSSVVGRGCFSDGAHDWGQSRKGDFIALSTRKATWSDRS